MSDIVVAFGLFLVIEGLAYALAPLFIRRMAALLPEISDYSLRLTGVLAVASGVFLVWLIRG